MSEKYSPKPESTWSHVTPLVECHTPPSTPTVVNFPFAKTIPLMSSLAPACVQVTPSPDVKLEWPAAVATNRPSPNSTSNRGSGGLKGRVVQPMPSLDVSSTPTPPKLGSCAVKPATTNIPFP